MKEKKEKLLQAEEKKADAAKKTPTKTKSSDSVDSSDEEDKDPQITDLKKRLEEIKKEIKSLFDIAEENLKTSKTFGTNIENQLKSFAEPHFHHQH